MMCTNDQHVGHAWVHAWSRGAAAADPHGSSLLPDLAVLQH